MKNGSLNLEGILWFKLPKDGYVQLRSVDDKQVEVYLLKEHIFDALRLGWVHTEAQLVLDRETIARLELEKQEKNSMFGKAKPLVRSKYLYKVV